MFRNISVSSVIIIDFYKTIRIATVNLEVAEFCDGLISREF
ncbi:hypothetical protein UF75_3315 [Desulfosporosinus sp. I2]|nr:hypothetical protein UF75_3315 [Desulfosporosinus sp. I2]